MYEQIFRISNQVALGGWVLLGLLPRWKITRLLVRSGFLSFLLSFLYFYFVVQAVYSEAGGNFRSLKSLSVLFESQDWLLAGWVHFLAFDLLVGDRIVFNWELRFWHPILCLPVLFLTFFLGPIGYFVDWILGKGIKGLLKKKKKVRQFKLKS